MANEVTWITNEIQQLQSAFRTPNIYRNIEPISRSTFGVVCSAINTQKQKPVAIKKISYINSPVLAKRVYREVVVLRQIQHFNLLQLYQVFTDAHNQNEFRNIYLVTELMDMDLRSLLMARRLTNNQIVLYTYSICSALKYMHSRGILHRDLKPENICLNVDNTLKVIDFGLAKLEEPQANLTAYVTTRWYRAPELLVLQTNYSSKIDMWSFGCIVAELFTRRAMFPGETSGPSNVSTRQLRRIVEILGFPEIEMQNTVYQKAVNAFRNFQNDGIQISSLEAELPHDIDQNALDFIKKLLVWDPDKRFSADQAIQHPYLQKYHLSEDEPTGLPFQDPFENTEKNLEEWKGILFNLVDLHQ